MRNWPRYSRGSFDAEEITRPLRKKIFFSVPLLRTQSVPVFCPRLSHWSRSPGSIVLRLPLTLMIGTGAEKGDELYGPPDCARYHCLQCLTRNFFSMRTISTRASSMP